MYVARIGQETGEIAKRFCDGNKLKTWFFLRLSRARGRETAKILIKVQVLIEHQRQITLLSDILAKNDSTDPQMDRGQLPLSLLLLRTISKVRKTNQIEIHLQQLSHIAKIVIMTNSPAK